MQTDTCEEDEGGH